jgi:transposase
MVASVVVSNPSTTRAFAAAKVKTDEADARILAQLLAADFLPPVRLPDGRTRLLRRQVTRRVRIVRQRTRPEPCPATDWPLLLVTSVSAVSLPNRV